MKTRHLFLLYGLTTYLGLSWFNLYTYQESGSFPVRLAGILLFVLIGALIKKGVEDILGNDGREKPIEEENGIMKQYKRIAQYVLISDLALLQYSSHYLFREPGHYIWIIGILCWIAGVGLVVKLTDLALK